MVIYFFKVISAQQCEHCVLFHITRLQSPSGPHWRNAQNVEKSHQCPLNLSVYWSITFGLIIASGEPIKSDTEALRSSFQNSFSDDETPVYVNLPDLCFALVSLLLSDGRQLLSDVNPGPKKRGLWLLAGLLSALSISYLDVANMLRVKKCYFTQGYSFKGK